jgi:hypothetical protein
MQRKYVIMLSLAVAMLVCLFTFGIYKLVLGSPPISLLNASFTVSSGDIYDFLNKVEVEEMTVQWITNGEIEALADGKVLLRLSYDLKSLANAIDLGERLAVPKSSRWMVDTVKFLLTPLRKQLIASNAFFYDVLPLKFSLSVNTG